MSEFKYGAMGAVLVIFGMIGSCQTTNYNIRKAIESGSDPILAACAIRSGVARCSGLMIIEIEKMKETK
jgi:hypothetical protein